MKYQTHKSLRLSWDGLTYHLRSKNIAEVTYHFEILCALLHHLQTTNHHVPTFFTFLSLPTLFISFVTLTSPLSLSLTLNNKVIHLFLTHNHTKTHFTFSPFSSLKQIIKHTLFITQFPFSSSKNQFFLFPTRKHNPKFNQNQFPLNQRSTFTSSHFLSPF